MISSTGFSPRWSPDGNHILFAGQVITGLGLNPQLIDADGSSPRRWPGDSNGAFGWQPGSSTVLLFASLSGPYDPRLTSWAVGAALTQSWEVDPKVRREFRAQQLSVVNGGEVMPSADMASLYFVGASRGTTAVWRIGLDAASRRIVTGPRRITTLLDANTAGLSPDGRRLVFGGAPRNAQNLVIFARRPWVDRSGTRRADPDAGHAEFPTLSRDGRAFAFGLTRPGSPERHEIVARLPGRTPRPDRSRHPGTTGTGHHAAVEP